VRQLELLFGAGLREPAQEPYRIMNVQAPAIVPPIDGRQSQTALKVARGTARLLHAHGYCVISEMPLPSGRRADLVALGHDGEIWIVEIKSSVADFRADQKWMDYRAHCRRCLRRPDRLRSARAPAARRDPQEHDAERRPHRGAAAAVAGRPGRALCRRDLVQRAK
jgi:hypothetical protein